MAVERRIVGSSLSLRSLGGSHKLVGHAAVFNRDSELIAGSFIERIAPGAFAESIAKPDDVRALINHDPNLILARNLSKTLFLQEDDQGLLVTIDPPKTTYAVDLLESVRRGDISQMSFGFETIADRWERGLNGHPDVRMLLKVRLFDVSLVTYPAYPDTDVAVRNHEQFLGRAVGVDLSSDVEVRRRRLRFEMLASGLSDWPVLSETQLRRRRLALETVAAGSMADVHEYELMDQHMRRRECQSTI